MSNTKGHIHTTPVAAVTSADKSKPIFPLMIANDGFSGVGEEKRASATCFCGHVQLSFVSRSPAHHPHLPMIGADSFDLVVPTFPL